MKLYHGSNVVVNNPKILDSDRALDFGNGFYLTTDMEQAKRWAVLTTKRRESGKPTVSVFNFNDDNNLKVLRFDKANKDWLRFVCNNRKRLRVDNSYDIIIGPVANDNTMPVINMYMSGGYDEDEALRRLMTQKLKDQVVFKNDNALEKIKFEGVTYYE